MSVIPLPRAEQTVALTVAVDRFLDRFRDNPGTRAAYAETLNRMRALAGDRLPTNDLTPELYEQVMTHWDTRAGSTWNKHLSALNSFTAYARRQEWLTSDPGRRLERRKVTRARDKAIPRIRLERLFTDNRHPLRERVLWRMLYETCARAEEILGLDAPDLDMEFRRALIVEKGGDRTYVHWELNRSGVELQRTLPGRL
ncbi:MAG: site-specific integrase [Pseudonocardiaceae bacterium]